MVSPTVKKPNKFLN